MVKHRAAKIRPQATAGDHSKIPPLIRQRDLAVGRSYFSRQSYHNIESFQIEGRLIRDIRMKIILERDQDTRTPSTLYRCQKSSQKLQNPLSENLPNTSLVMKIGGFHQFPDAR